MNLVMLSPGYPAEMAYFTRALARVGARVIGVGDQPPQALPDAARQALAHYEHVNLADGDAVLRALQGLSRHASIDQVECLWEPYMILAARLRETFGLPGMTVEQTLPFRDKEHMKRVLDAAGIRTPWHVSATSVAGIWEAAEKVGFPLIVKPIAGAGSADTYRVDSAEQLGEVLPLLLHVPEVSVEEFVDGEELTFDTICAGGEILFEHVLWYRPRPLQMRMHEWVSPVSISLRELDVPSA
jgi:biotin carboxylase